MSFLTAEWRKLAIANYAVDPQVLRSYVPAGTELDLWNGTCYVSLSRRDREVISAECIS